MGMYCSSSHVAGHCQGCGRESSSEGLEGQFGRVGDNGGGRECESGISGYSPCEQPAEDFTYAIRLEVQNGWFV